MQHQQQQQLAAASPAGTPARRPRGAAPAAAARLDDYVLGRAIGAGGSATVVRAHAAADPRRGVALKMLDRRRLSRRAQRYLAREINLHRLVSAHPHVVRLHDAFDTRDAVVLVLELLRGGDLYSMLRRERRALSARAALVVLRQVVDALAFLHANGVAHRDLKLENIMFVRPSAGRPRGAQGPAALHVKIVDFGLACYRDPAAPPAGRLSREPCGTKNYCAPEVLRAREAPYSPDKADIWSAGVVLFAMLTRRLPFGAVGGSGPDFAHQPGSPAQGAAAPGPPDAVVYKVDYSAADLRKLPRGVIALLKKLLCINAAKRPSATEVGEMIGELLNDREVIRSDPEVALPPDAVGSTDMKAQEDADAEADTEAEDGGASSDERAVVKVRAKRERELEQGGREPRRARDARDHVCPLPPSTSSPPPGDAARVAANAALDCICSDVSCLPRSPHEPMDADSPPSGGSATQGDTSEAAPQQQPFNLGFFRGIFDVFNRSNSSGSASAQGSPGSSVPELPAAYTPAAGYTAMSPALAPRPVHARRDYTPVSPSRLSTSAPCTPAVSPLPTLLPAAKRGQEHAREPGSL